MREPRKATADTTLAAYAWVLAILALEPRAPSHEPALDLYALAQVRAREVESTFGGKCRDCPGEPCSRRPKGPFLGRTDWTSCPLGMLRNPAQRELVDLFWASKVSPIDGFPECLSAWGHDAMIALKQAVGVEDERRAEAARKGQREG